MRADEVREETKVKLETQTQLVTVFNEHNRALQIQVRLLEYTNNILECTEFY